MIFVQSTACDSPVVGFEVLDELNQQEHLLPKFDMPVNADRDHHVDFIRNNDVGHHIAMHVRDLVGLGLGDVIQVYFMQVHCR